MLLKQVYKRIGNQRGDSFVSVIIAAGLLSGTAVVGGGVMKLMRKDQSYTTSVSTAIAAESAIMQALQSPLTFQDPSHTAAMRAGGANLLTGVAINGERGVFGQGVTLARIGTPTQLTRLGVPCNGGQTNPIKEDFCAVTTNVQVNCETGGTLCRAAYQVAISTAANDGAAVPPLGAPSWPPRAPSADPNQPHDFNMVISYDLYRRGGATTSCAPNELFVSAVDKSNGTVTCGRPATRTLPPNQIPDGVVYEAGTNSLELRARGVGQATCPDSRYVLQGVDPRSLDQASSVSGTCIYRYQPVVPWMDSWPSGRDSVTMNVCPSADYDIVPDGNCTMREISRTRGFCAKTCQDGNGYWYDCSEEVDPIISYHIVQDPPPGNRKNGAQVSCTLVQDGVQPCQASWRGEVVWSGRCELNQPRRIPAVRR